MKTRKPNRKDKIRLVKGCIEEIIKCILDFNISGIIFAWLVMTEGLKGNCEIVIVEE